MIRSQASLERLIEAVQDATSAVELAAARIEQSSRQQITTEKEDLAIVRGWLRDTAQIAALVCDQPNPVSKELGARLEAITVSLTISLGTQLDLP